MDRQVLKRLRLGVLLFAVLTGGCQQGLMVTPRPPESLRRSPNDYLAGFLYVRAQPPVATESVEIVIRNAEGKELFTYDFERGELVTIREALSPGTFQLSGEPWQCTGEFPIREASETEVALHRASGRTCSLAVIEHSGAQSEESAIGGRVTASILDNAIMVEIASLDSPPNPVPARKGLDEEGNFYFTGLSAGRYLVTARSGPVSVATHVEVEVGRDIRDHRSSLAIRMSSSAG